MLVPKGGRGLHDFLKLVLVCASDCKIRDLRRFQLALGLGYDHRSWVGVSRTKGSMMLFDRLHAVLDLALESQL